MDVYQLIKLHEGFRATPYKDTRGILTIGYGQRVDELSIDESTASGWMKRRVQKLGGLLLHVDGFPLQNDVRRAVLIDMAYQLGLDGLLAFHDMWRALEHDDFERAANAMLDSEWARQTPERASDLARYMRDGSWPGTY